MSKPPRFQVGDKVKRVEKQRGRYYEYHYHDDVVADVFLYQNIKRLTLKAFGNDYPFTTRRVLTLEEYRKGPGPAYDIKIAKQHRDEGIRRQKEDAFLSYVLGSLFLIEEEEGEDVAVRKLRSIISLKYGWDKKCMVCLEEKCTCVGGGRLIE